MVAEQGENFALPPCKRGLNRFLGGGMLKNAISLSKRRIINKQVLAAAWTTIKAW